MNRLFIATTLSASIIFTACSQTNAFDFFSSDTYYEKAVSNMQKVSLMRDMETKALVHAVYLNNVDPHIYFGDEYFYVAMHIIEDAYDPKKHGLKNLDYRLRMINEHTEKAEDDITKMPEYKDTAVVQEEKKETEIAYFDPIEATELDEDHKLRRTMPIRNQWNHYYLVRYKEVNASVLRLSFENDQYGKAQLTFQKEK
jgi:hypothetical protein